jgi:hypothetical protein
VVWVGDWSVGSDRGGNVCVWRRGLCFLYVCMYSTPIHVVFLELEIKSNQIKCTKFVKILYE